MEQGPGGGGLPDGIEIGKLFLWNVFLHTLKFPGTFWDLEVKNGSPAKSSI
jgi:hypothetical protein